jgi:DNA-binding transcriptional regulator YdaS (Cro superfamily)
MTLRDFMRARSLTPYGLARVLGLPRRTVLGYLDGSRRPEPEQIPAIVEATGGDVTAAELRPDLAELFRASSPAEAASAA